MALEQVTVTEAQQGTTRTYRGRHRGRIVMLSVGQVPTDVTGIEIYEEADDGTLYCIRRTGDDVVADRWTPNQNHQKVEKTVTGGDPLGDVLPTLLGDFPEDVRQQLGPG